MSRCKLYLLLYFHLWILCLVCTHWYPKFKTKVLKSQNESNYQIFFLPFLYYYLIIPFVFNLLIKRNLHCHHHLNSYKHPHLCLIFLPNLALDSASMTFYNWLLALGKQVLLKSVHVICLQESDHHIKVITQFVFNKLLHKTHHNSAQELNIFWG